MPQWFKHPCDSQGFRPDHADVLAARANEAREPAVANIRLLLSEGSLAAQMNLRRYIDVADQIAAKVLPIAFGEAGVIAGEAP